MSKQSQRNPNFLILAIALAVGWTALTVWWDNYQAEQQAVAERQAK